MLLIEDIDHTPDAEAFHYFRRRAGANARESAEEFLRQQGCTHIQHSIDGNSYGIVERREVVQQRILQPHG